MARGHDRSSGLFAAHPPRERRRSSRPAAPHRRPPSPRRGSTCSPTCCARYASAVRCSSRWRQPRHRAPGRGVDAGAAGRRSRRVALGAGRAFRSRRRAAADALSDAVADAAGGETAGGRHGKGLRRGARGRLRVRGGVQPRVQEDCGDAARRLARARLTRARLAERRARNATAWRRSRRQAGASVVTLRTIPPRLSPTTTRSQAGRR